MSRVSPVAQSFLRLARPSPRVASFRSLSSTSHLRAEPTPEASTSTPPPPPANLSPKLSAIVDQISGLTLLEAADLVDALKSRLNIVDIALPAAAPAAAAPAAGAAAAEPEPEKPKEKTVFNVNLTKIDAAQKAKAIREVKAIMPGMNLVEAKKFVESLPKTLKEGATKEEAEKLQALFKGIGAEVALD
ncbi:mitochondrial 54S ribosomal protein bL12m MNP1 [Rhodotorula paludigena]|uniref:mitochondrial 54S ribosomal protein bL12m MNP1 n=1 Tax=Rhodotorula paludigena TaxID=86838 RepID=UPI00317A3FCC